MISDRLKPSLFWLSSLDMKQGTNKSKQNWAQQTTEVLEEKKNVTTYLYINP